MGKRLKLLVFRKQEGLTQQQMAEKLGITSTHYSRIETGDSNPSYELLKKFQEEFGLIETLDLFEKNY